ncbi:hypothetical protein ACVWWR_004227 [Bradyrhizobium sp. LM3.2]
MSRATTESVAEIKARNKQLIDEVLKVYPEKTAKRRAKHLSVHEVGKSDCGVKSNIKSIPGVMTIRGCAYAGSKGVVWGPIKDMIHISHGPVGCGQYSWGLAAQLLRRHDRHRHVRDTAVHFRFPGKGYRVRRR